MARNTQNQATSGPKNESIDQDKDHVLGHSGSKNNPIVVEDDDESSSKHPFRPNESSKDLLLVAEANYQNTSLVLTN
jgi:hypothetical protein